MCRRYFCHLLRVFVVCGVACWLLAAPLLSHAATNDSPLVDRFEAQKLRLWQDRLVRLDAALPEPGLLEIDSLIAYEENEHFAYAFGQPSRKDDGPLPLWFRRVLLIKPGLLAVDDLWGIPTPNQRIGRVGWTAEPIVVPPDGKGPLVGLDRIRWVETDDPVGNLPATSTQGPADTDGNATAGATQTAVRTLCLFQFGDSSAGSPTVSFESPADRQDWKLTIGFSGRPFHIDLPRRYVDPGWLAADASDSGQRIERRALPAGILPHGEQGLRLIERWDRPYRGGQRPGWDTGLTAEDLKQAVEAGHIKPCRVVELGCGSGTNAVYLAGLGFDVTAIDVAPTALGIAEAKANQAGVQVRWLLADVLKLPDLGTFDLIFDRGCYHNVRYVDADGFVKAMRRLTHPGSRALIVSLNRDGPPGVREQTMRDDFSDSFDFVWMKESEIQTGPDGSQRRASWSLMLQRK